MNSTRRRDYLTSAFAPTSTRNRVRRSRKWLTDSLINGVEKAGDGLKNAASRLRDRSPDIERAVQGITDSIASNLEQGGSYLSEHRRSRFGSRGFMRRHPLMALVAGLALAAIFFNSSRR